MTSLCCAGEGGWGELYIFKDSEGVYFGKVDLERCIALESWEVIAIKIGDF